MERTPRPPEAKDVEHIVGGENGVTEAAAEVLNGLAPEDLDLWLYPFDGGWVLNGYYRLTEDSEWLAYPDDFPDPVEEKPKPRARKKKVEEKESS